MTGRAAIRQPFDDVAVWAAGQPGRCLVTDAGDHWTICDLDGPTAEQLAARFRRDVWVAEDDEVWRVAPEGSRMPLPLWIDDPDDAVEVETFKALWSNVPELLTDVEPRLSAPTALQTLIMPTLAEEDLRAVLTGMAVPITVVDLNGWSVVASHSEDLAVIASGLTVPRKSWALVLSHGGGLASVRVVGRGRMSAEHVWNRRTLLVGGSDDGSWRGNFPAAVDAAELAQLVRTSESEDQAAALQTLLCRDDAPSDVLNELLRHLALGAAGRVALDVLEGHPLSAHPEARRIEPPDSYWQWLKAAGAGAYLDPDAVPWFSILCAVIFFPLAASLLYHSFQLATGSLDGWGTVHLVTAVINTPFAYMYLRRVLRWRAMRRPG